MEDGEITFTPLNSNVISYSIDGGDTWTEGNSVNVENGAKVLWKGEMTPLEWYGIGTFSSTCNFEVQGNVMSLLFGDDFKNKLNLEGKVSCFLNLFSKSNVVSAENLSLPATTLAIECYSSMFSRCTSLTSVPELPATTLVYSCYSSMFKGCTSLTTAPELLATTMTDSCYEYMFNGCTNLNYIKMMATNISASLCLSGWVNGVAATGTFVKNSDAQWDVSGINGIPEGWTVETASA